MSFTDILISTLTGVLASYAVWWFTLKYLTPKIRFAPAISRLQTTENPSGYRYRFKFENTGQRNIIDVEVVVRVRIRGLPDRPSGNWEVIYLPISSMEYKKIAIVRSAHKHLPRHQPVRPVFEIKGYDCDYFQHSIFDEATQQRSRERTLTLEQILALGKETNLQILLLAFDEYSGARKFFESPEMTLNNIEDGYYDKYSVFIVPPKPVKK